ncbi:MAG: phosphoglycerate kinase [Nitrososphaerales archaeon]|jgi:phosphoglycerate kinase|nr:phosphoglycerate kinase [Nitrososphaerales archaeon]|tara:strand:+ start:8258 stop:9457 length:1200 start_codon:yes stop_codon:yes gene_type:complete
MLSIEDMNITGKTVFVRVDMNTPIDPKTGKLMEFNRIKEASVTIRDLKKSKVVVASHQGRVGRNDFISLEQHAEALANFLGYEVKFVDDIFGPTARKKIDSLSIGEVLLLDNLRLSAEENKEFIPKDAAKTMLVQRLYKLFDACVLDSFPTAHRSCPSIVGFSELLPSCGGRIVEKELKALNKLLNVAKGICATVLGGAKISDRLEAIDTLIANNRADKVLLTGTVGNVFLKASGQLDAKLGIDDEVKYVKQAKKLLTNHPDVFEMPKDVAIMSNDSRVEVLIKELKPNDKILDIGSMTIDNYSRIIKSSGTIFMSGPPGMFEDNRFSKGTEELLRAMASSFGTTIVSGGHLSAALERIGRKELIDHVSTAGGALVLFLAGKKLPLLEVLDKSARKKIK